MPLALQSRALQRQAVREELRTVEAHIRELSRNEFPALTYTFTGHDPREELAAARRHAASLRVLLRGLS